MRHYLFLTDSKFVHDKLTNFLPNHYQDKENLLKYDYNGNQIYINKFVNDRLKMTILFQNIADLIFKFDKIFLLLGNISNDFRMYINGLANNLVKLETDVIVFKLKSIKSEFNYREDCMCCYVLCFVCFGCFGYKGYYVQSSDAIYVNIQITDDFDYDPNYFINYLSKNDDDLDKTIKSETIKRETIPIVIAELISTPETTHNDNIPEIAHNDNIIDNNIIDHNIKKNNNPEPSAPHYIKR